MSKDVDNIASIPDLVCSAACILASNKGSNSQGDDWFDVWKQNQESKDVQTEIDHIHKERQGPTTADDTSASH